VEGWVKFDGPFTGFQTLASAFQCNSQTLWWFGTYNNELRVYISNRSAYPDGPGTVFPPTGWTVDTDLQTGRWYHMALVYDGNAATKAEQLKIYVNGQNYPLASYATYPAFPTVLPSDLPIVYLGHEPGLFVNYPSTPLRGKLDDWRIYTVARNSADIANDATGQ
jgi:hypothetical protein